MFTGPVTVHRSSWHYKLWCFTYRNGLWKKSVPSQRSICAYTHRIIWIGLITAILHLTIFPLKWVIKDFLFDLILTPLGERKFLATTLIWLLGLCACFYFELEHVLIGWLSFVILFVTVLLCIVGIVFLFCKLFSLFYNHALRPVISFNRGLFFFLFIGGPKAVEFSREYPRFSKLTGQLLFWTEFVGINLILISPLIILGYAFGSLESGELWTLLLYLLTGGAFALFLTYIITETMYQHAQVPQEDYYWRRRRMQAPQEEPVKPKKAEHAGPSWWERNLLPFWQLVKAMKDRVCPLIRFAE